MPAESDTIVIVDTDPGWERLLLAEHRIVHRLCRRLLVHRCKDALSNPVSAIGRLRCTLRGRSLRGRSGNVSSQESAVSKG